MPKLPEDLPECMVFLLGKAYQKAHSNFKKQLKKYGLTNMQHLVLEGLWYDEGMTAAELCKKLDEKGICAWDGHFYAIRPVEVLGLLEKGGLTRIGFSLYNRQEEIERVLGVLNELDKNN